MDMQTGTLSQLPQTTTATVVANVNKAIAQAHEKDIPVIYVVVGFRADTPEIGGNNKGFSAGKETFTPEMMKQFMKIYPDITHGENDIVVTKRRISAFTGSDLEVILRAQNIRHIILTGISTSGVVLSTIREAADKDFQITLLEDGCVDRDEEVHRVLITKVFPRQAEVLTVEEWVKSLI